MNESIYDDLMEQDNKPGMDDYKQRALEKSKSGFDKVHDELGKLWLRITDKGDPTRQRVTFRERFRQLSSWSIAGPRSARTGQQGRFVGHIGELENTEQSNSSDHNTRTFVQQKTELKREQSYDELQFQGPAESDLTPFSKSFNNGDNLKASCSARLLSKSLPFLPPDKHIQEGTSLLSRHESLGTDENGWPIPNTSEASVETCILTNSDDVSMGSFDDDDVMSELHDYENTEHMRINEENVDNKEVDRDKGACAKTVDERDTHVFEDETKEVPRLEDSDGYVFIYDKDSGKQTTQLSSQRAMTQTTSYRPPQGGQPDNVTTESSQRTSPKETDVFKKKHVKPPRPDHLSQYHHQQQQPQQQQHQQQKQQGQQQQDTPQQATKNVTTQAPRTEEPTVAREETRQLTSTGKSSVVRAGNSSERREMFFNMSVEDVVDCFRACALSGLATVCKDERLDGEYFRDMNDISLQDEPFKLTQFQINKLSRVIAGWRPKHSVTV